MSRIHGKLRKTAGIVASLFVIYLTVRIKNYEHAASVFLPNTHPNEVWEFVADFSNMKYLNPTITSFTILSESGNYDHWKYSAEYSEFLSHWPHLRNVGIAHFNVKADKEKNIFVISSVHRTCLLFGFFCLNSESEFKLTHANSSKGAFCQENIIYQCPAVMSSFCKREVAFQRTAIMKNLQAHFSKK